jgi:amino acid transporter
MTESLILQLNREKTIFRALVGTLLVCAGLYIYFINATVHNVVARQNLEAESAQLSLSIGSKEFQYITKRNSVTLALAHSLGFQDAEVKAYISNDPTASVAFLSR